MNIFEAIHKLETTPFILGCTFQDRTNYKKLKEIAQNNNLFLAQMPSTKYMYELRRL